jgi:hypothetical protein
MKPATLFGVAVLVALVAPTAHYLMRASAASNGLKCEVTETTKVDNIPPDLKTVTWIIKLAGEKWFFVSFDGVPAAEVYKTGDPPKWAAGLPLRATDQTYFLMEEKRDEQDPKYVTWNTAWTVDRTTGQMNGTNGLNSKNDPRPLNSVTDITGHCEPITLQANM